MASKTYTGPSVPDMIRDKTLAANIIKFHNHPTSDSILDDENLDVLQRFVEDPSKREQILKDEGIDPDESLRGKQASLAVFAVWAHRRADMDGGMLSSMGSDADETMRIFVKTVSGDSTIPLSIPANTSISTLRSLLALRTNLPEPADLRLVYAGKHLSSASTTLGEYAIAPNATLHMALPMRGGMPPKKIRCSHKECKDAAQRIVGDCGFCNGHFCGKHRLLEDHTCEGLEDCKKESHERNANKLNSERTMAIRGI